MILLKHERMISRREELGLTQIQLANLVGVTQQAITKWESGKTTRPNRLKELAAALQCSDDWLLGSSSKPQPPKGVGLISWVQAGAMAEVIDSYQPGDAEAWIDYPARHTKMIALRVRGRSMNRVSPDGSIIVIDLTDREMTGNRLYVVKIGNDATYKRYRDNPPRLEPDSTDKHDAIYLDGQKAYVVGRVVRTFTDFE